ncbi:hypothetical protein [Flavilitoribacter nigricans]|uniref:Uncharacterized protein n=1 Tax=Flavilitoribacter nigricans (strain ATCC 23147 / DSM 23189 / NBRC 102662 / NCIMB 1420 / SS-2) TaxID=1122177 RepID=A0A2D0NDZ9_FLAN2|nr:hypothetical protein [Flavilitoribacter nigricans]PHN06744.1 hypothetical protein CRP01_10650 [Flavilitoribacter nigricans DSM 23189 = NBRC 102662]
MKKELLFSAILATTLFVFFRLVIFRDHWDAGIDVSWHDSYYVLSPVLTTGWLVGLILFLVYWVRSLRSWFQYRPINTVLLGLSGLLVLSHGLLFIFLQQMGSSPLSVLVLGILLTSLCSLVFLGWKTRQR